MTLAVITIASGRHEHLDRQLDGLAAGEQRPDLHVVVAMADPGIAAVVSRRACVVPCAGDPALLPLATARNLGARHALAAGADALVFLDVDCIPAPGAIADYARALERHPGALLTGEVGYLPPLPDGGYPLDALASLATPHPARPIPDGADTVPLDHRMFWSLSFALDRATWAAIGGFHEGYLGYGGEDTDFGQLARQRSVALLAIAGARVYHQWHPSPSPPLHHLDDIVPNARVFHARWGWWPMRGWLDAFAERGLVRYDEVTDDWIVC